MPIEPKRLAELLETLETTGRRYHALGVAGALKAAHSGAGMPLSAPIAAAKAAWQAAEKALADYRASKLWGSQK